VLKWAELLQIRSSNAVSYKSMLLYYNWLTDRLARNVPMDQTVQELLGANGGTFKNPATNYYQNETIRSRCRRTWPGVHGMRIQCASATITVRPLDSGRLLQFRGLLHADWRKGTDDPREIVVFNSGAGEMTHPVKKVVMKPKFLGGASPDTAGKDRRVVMAKWLASPENRTSPRTCRTSSGRTSLARHHPRAGRRPHQQPGLQSGTAGGAGKKFTDYKYDFKKLVRDICTSRTYQLSTQPTRPTRATRATSPVPVFAGSRPRRSSTASAR